MSRSSRALVFHGPDLPLELTDFPTPEPEGSEVLVEVAACTLCGSDFHTMQGRRIEPVPTVLGHEILGRIAAFGPAAPHRDAAGRPLELGDRVTWAIVASCGQCFFCRRSLPQKCERRVKYGHEAIAPGRELTGGLAEHCLLATGSSIFRVPDRLPDESACPANCATATVAGAIEAADELAGRVILIMGCGMLGVTACRLGRRGRLLERHRLRPRPRSPRPGAGLRRDACRLARGAGPLPVGGDQRPRRRRGHRADRLARRLRGDVSAGPAGGTIVLVGATYPVRPIRLAMEDVVRRCLTIRGLHNYAPRHLRAAIEFLDAHPEYPFESLVAAWNPLERVAEAVTQGLEPRRPAARRAARGQRHHSV